MKNGLDEHKCLINEIWGDFRPQDMKHTLGQISNHTQHLTKLDTIADHLMDAATGRKQVPLSVFMIVVLTLCLIGIFIFIGERTVKITPRGVEIFSQDAKYSSGAARAEEKDLRTIN